MAIDGGLLEWFTQQLTIKKRSGVNRYAEDAHTGTAVTYDCFIEPGTSMVRDMNGKEVVSQGTVYVDVAGKALIEVTDEMVFPDGLPRIILNIFTRRDTDASTHHQEIAF